MSEGSLRTGPFCDPARVFTGDGVLCSVGRRGEPSTRVELSFRLGPLVKAVLSPPRAPDFLLRLYITQRRRNNPATDGWLFGGLLQCQMS